MLDPQIPLGAKVPQVQSFQKALSDIAAVKGQQQENEIRADDLRKRQEAAKSAASVQAQQAILNGAVAEYTDPQTGAVDTERVLTKLRLAGAAGLANTVEADWLKVVSDRTDGELKTINTELKKYELGQAIIGSISDEATAEAAKPQIFKWFGPAAVQAMGHGFDPDTLKKLGTLAKGYIENLKLQDEASRAHLDYLDARKKGAISELQLRSLATVSAARTLSLAAERGKAEYIVARLRLLSEGAIPAAVLDQFPQGDQWTPTTAAKIAQAGLTVDQSEDNKRAANQLALDQARERRLAAAEATAGKADAALPNDVRKVLATYLDQYATATEARAAARKAMPGWATQFDGLDAVKVGQYISGLYDPPGMGTQNAAADADRLVGGVPSPTPSPSPSATAKPAAPKRQVGEEVELTLNAAGEYDPNGTKTKVRITGVTDKGYSFEVVKKK